MKGLIQKIGVALLASFFALGNLGAQEQQECQGAPILFKDLRAITTDAAGNLYLIEGNSIGKINTLHEYEKLAGSVDERGFKEGFRGEIRFESPTDLDLDSKGNIFVSDSYNYVIRKISPTGFSSTVGGVPKVGAYRDKNFVTGDPSYFSYAQGLAIHYDILYIADTGNQVIRNLFPNFVDLTMLYAGMGPAYGEDRDGPAGASSFRFPRDLSLDERTGDLYVITPSYDRVRRVSSNNVRKVNAWGDVSTVAFQVGSSFNSIEIDPTGRIFLSDLADKLVYELDPSGRLRLIAGQKGVSGKSDGRGDWASFTQPMGLAAGLKGELYMTDQDRIRKIEFYKTPLGTEEVQVSTLKVCAKECRLGQNCTPIFH